MAELRLVRRTVSDDVFRKQEVDLLVTPTIRKLPWPIEDELTRAASTRARTPEPGNTRSLDDYGLPTITVPCGYSKSGSPVGLQISGPSLGEIHVLALAHAYEQATEWHKRRPPLDAGTKVPGCPRPRPARPENPSTASLYWARAALHVPSSTVALPSGAPD